jgi:hypothetical protein
MILGRSFRRTLAHAKVALCNLCLLAVLVSTGPLLASEGGESCNTTQAKESSVECVVGIESRVLRVRLLWTAAELLPSGHGYLRPRPQIARSLIGHTLSNELLAPLRC